MTPSAAPLVVLLGPTAVGKTALSLELAERLGAEIVSADSRCIYRGLDIGTAKPTAAERARIPHHLIDVTTADRPWTLAEFQPAAVEAIADIRRRGLLALLVGGTGQYIRALTEGWQVPPGDPSGETRAALEAALAADGLAALAARLREIDPESAARIDLRNPRRVVRALEVALTTGQSFVAQRRRSGAPFQVVQIGLTRPRPELYQRIDARIQQMLADGLVEEVRGLAARGYGWNLPAMSALGYRQIGEYLRGECDLDEAVRRLRQATRVFVRRQANWFKPDDPAVRWHDAGRVTADQLVEFILSH